MMSRTTSRLLIGALCLVAAGVSICAAEEGQLRPRAPRRPVLGITRTAHVAASQNDDDDDLDEDDLDEDELEEDDLDEDDLDEDELDDDDDLDDDFDDDFDDDLDDDDDDDDDDDEEEDDAV